MKKKVVIESLDAENRRLWKQLEAKWQRVRDLETELVAAQSRITELEEVEKDWSVINGELAEATLRISQLKTQLDEGSEGILRQRIKHLEMALSDRNTETAQQYARIGELEKRLAALEADYIDRQGDGR